VSNEFKRIKRMRELADVLRELQARQPPPASLLEIGAGAGWQAAGLAEAGYAVSAIDLAGSEFSEERVFPITDYDGRRIPFPDAAFDLLFSSNVLQSIPGLPEYQREMQRVLKPRGLAFHVVPSGSWRFWSNLTHYVFAGKVAGAMARARILSWLPGGEEAAKAVKLGVTRRHRTPGETLRKVLVPTPIGPYGNAVTEIRRLSRSGWESAFTEAGWRVEAAMPSHLFYTAHSALGPLISVTQREWLSRLLGSSCHLFVLSRSCAS
jgi:SAM-dependent methyltransferase